MKRVANNCADTLYIYSVYDDNDVLVMTGPLDDVIEYLGITRRKSFFETASRWKKKHNEKTVQGMKIRGRYVYYIGEEKMKEKKCKLCGKIKPLSDFPKHTSSNGKVVTRNVCKVCISNKRRYKENDTK